MTKTFIKWLQNQLWINTIVLPSNGKKDGAVFIGKYAKALYFSGFLDRGVGFQKLYKSRPGKYFLVFTPTGKLIYETGDRKSTELYLRSKNVLVYTE